MPDYSSLSCVSQVWVSRALSDQTLFSDSPPRWRNLPSYLSSRHERDARVRLFRKFDADDLAQKLEKCTPSLPCSSGACPVCTRALQRHFVLQSYPLLQPTSEFVLLSVIPNLPVLLGALSRLSITDFTDSIGLKLAKSRMHFGLGGVDFTYNEHRDGHFSSHWAPHVWMLTNKYNRARWETLLRRKFVRTQAIRRPVKINEWDGNRAAIGYSLKYKFGRRISDVGQRGEAARVCKITTYDRLRSAERFELYSYLNEIGLGSRILLMGIESSRPPLLRLADDC
jgi:hypothetical protein